MRIGLYCLARCFTGVDVRSVNCLRPNSWHSRSHRYGSERHPAEYAASLYDDDRAARRRRDP